LPPVSATTYCSYGKIQAGRQICRARALKFRNVRWVVPAVLVVCTSVNIHSTGLHTPSLPYLPRLLSTSTETVQLTVSLNLVAYAFAHLLYGPLSDQFDGRQFLRVGMGGLLFVRITSGVVVLIIRELFDRVTPSGSGRIMG
jgi:MFS family permease